MEIWHWVNLSGLFRSIIFNKCQMVNIHNRTSRLEVIQSYLSIMNNHVPLCCFYGDKNPSLKVTNQNATAVSLFVCTYVCMRALVGRATTVALGIV